jgi:hypothetical protein
MVTVAALAQSGDEWLTWSAARAEGIGKAAYVRGRVGSFFDTRLLKTERSTNYKLAATWMTPDVMRATARMQQLTERLTDDQALALLAEADGAGDTVVMVEIDPREGSGVVPDDWSAFLQPVLSDGNLGQPVRGRNTPKLREVNALRGPLRRNYDYDRFWVVFPLTHDDGSPVFPSGSTGAELVVRIHDREGRVRWSMPQNMTRRQ